MPSASQLSLVRLSRELQKYTGAETSPFCNIHTKHAPHFHIHPNLLASNFFQRRQQFLKKIKEIVATAHSNDELLEYAEDEEVSFMLHHFGIQEVIEMIERYKEEKEIRELSSGSRQSISFCDTKSACLQQKKKTSKRKKTNWEKISGDTSLYTLWLLMSLRDLQRMPNKDEWEMSSVCHKLLCLGKQTDADVSGRELFKMIRCHSLSKLHKKMKYVKKLDNNEEIEMDKRQMIRTCNVLKSWTKTGMKAISNTFLNDGFQLMARTFFNYHDCKICQFPHAHYENYGVDLLTDREYEVSSTDISNNHHYAKTIGVIKICVTNDLIQRVDELIDVSDKCVIHHEHFIALKMIRCATKLAAGFIKIDDIKSLIKRKKKLSVIWWTHECNYCQKKSVKANGDRKHKACSGCMKVAYCSRMCQKLDWNAKHRNECNRSWDSLHSALKMTLFDRI